MPEPRAFEVEKVIGKLKRHKSQVLIHSQQNRLNQEVGQFALMSINLFNLFGIRRNCLRSGRSRSLYLSTRRAIKQTVVIIGAYHFLNLVRDFIQHPAFKVNAVCKGNYWGSSVWI